MTREPTIGAPVRMSESSPRFRVFGSGALVLGTLAFIVVGCAPKLATRLADPGLEEPAIAEPATAAPKKSATASRTERGAVSHYGHAFAGRKTASGEVFDPDALTMAHRTLPFGTRVRVTNLENQRSIELVVNDRGPFIAGRIADVSLGAARALAMVSDGVVDGSLEIVEPAKAR